MQPATSQEVRGGSAYEALTFGVDGYRYDGADDGGQYRAGGCVLKRATPPVR